jgi:SPP1 gp7 family putative phage head morphogenesis protein
MTTLNTVLYDQAIELGIDMERVSASSRYETIQLIKKLEKELIAQVASGVTDWNKARIAKQLSEATKIIQQYYDEMAGVMVDTTTSVAQVSATSTAQALGVATGNYIPTVLPSATWLETIASNVIVQGATQSAWWNRQSADTAWRFSTAVRQGLVAAETNQQIIKRVMDVMDVSRKNAATLVQTSVQSVANQAKEKTSQANINLIASREWVATLDKITCIKCAVRDGKRWKLDGTPIGHSIPYQAPPIHFNDRCTMVDVTKTWKELGIDIEEAPEGTRASLEGQVSDKTFEEFLARKGKDYQDSVLGIGRADLWRKKVITFDQLLSGGNELTLKQLQDKYIK